jgi:hypothetical protein
MVILLTLCDVGRLSQIKTVDCKPEVLYISDIEGHITQIPTATRTFSTLSESMVTPPILHDNMKI